MPLPHLEAFVDAEKLIIAGSEIWELSPLAKTTSSVLRLAENSNGEKRVLKAVEKIYGQGAFGKRGFGERELDVSHKLDEVREKPIISNFLTNDGN